MVFTLYDSSVLKLDLKRTMCVSLKYVVARNDSPPRTNQQSRIHIYREHKGMNEEGGRRARTHCIVVAGFNRRSLGEKSDDGIWL